MGSEKRNCGKGFPENYVSHPRPDGRGGSGGRTLRLPPMSGTRQPRNGRSSALGNGTPGRGRDPGAGTGRPGRGRDPPGGDATPAGPWTGRADVSEPGSGQRHSRVPRGLGVGSEPQRLDVRGAVPPALPVPAQGSSAQPSAVRPLPRSPAPPAARNAVNAKSPRAPPQRLRAVGNLAAGDPTGS